MSLHGEVSVAEKAQRIHPRDIKVAQRGITILRKGLHDNMLVTFRTGNVFQLGLVKGATKDNYVIVPVDGVRNFVEPELIQPRQG